MTAKTLKKKYPDYWNYVEQNVIDDMQTMTSIVHINDVKMIAHNAAFFATVEYNSRKKAGLR